MDNNYRDAVLYHIARTNKRDAVIKPEMLLEASEKLAAAICKSGGSVGLLTLVRPWDRAMERSTLELVEFLRTI